MKQFLGLVERVLISGKKKTDPQGIGNLAVCGHEMRFGNPNGIDSDVQEFEFPLITTRSLKGSFKALIAELFWFLSGSTHVADLHKHNVHFWDQWATPEICKQMGLPPGELGPIYGRQWRAFNGGGKEPVDQIAQVIKDLKRNPDSRRLVVSSWNPVDADRVFVAPCHCFYKFFHAEGILSLHLFQRSADIMVGVPFNIAEYYLYLILMSRMMGFKIGEFVHTLSDAHIYLDQVEFAKEQITREPRPLPSIRIKEGAPNNIFELSPDDFSLFNYNPHPAMKIPVAL